MVNGKEVPYTDAKAGNPAVAAAVAAAGYPKTGDAGIVKMSNPFDIFRPQVAAIIGLLFILVIFVTMVYGPISGDAGRTVPDQDPLHLDVAALPHRQRLVRRIAARHRIAIVASTGDIYAGLWYPIIFAAITVVIGFFFLPETKDVDIKTN